jgi:hypothetical protein
MVDWVTTTGISLASLPRFVTSYTKYRIDAELTIHCNCCLHCSPENCVDDAD